ncbi:hypothetical protein J3R82DRAFT_379 [Butyriboletus roseoflavus]|nr:hypothetical protein J3R82DRAFT_379 [Butyriboletus roseoflavus]
MAVTPPRSASPSHPPVVPKPGHTLQISPNLEALLEHDELTRRNSSSPTRSYHTATSPDFPFSLPPPPPRKAKNSLKTGQREQEPFPTMRSKEVQRKKMAADFWPDALPTTYPPDGSAAVQPMPGSSSRPVTPNPYLNPIPILRPVDTDTTDEVSTPKQPEKTLPVEPKFESLRGQTSTPDAFHRPSKVEKILWMGRDSLNLFSGSGNGLKRHDSDRRNDHAECGEVDAVQGNGLQETGWLNGATADSQMRQLSVTDSGPLPTATVTLSSRPYPLQSASTPSITFVSASINNQISPSPTVHLPPRPSSPYISMSHNSSPQLPSIDDYLSFIDFFSPSTSDDSNSYNIQDNSQETTSSRRQPQSISIPPSTLHSTTDHNISSDSLPSMRFAPPSPTSIPAQQLSPTYPHSGASSSSLTLSSMMFAPPSPSVERVPPTRLQPLSGPPSPYSPVEFAPLPSPPYIDNHSHPSAPELASERGRRLKSNKRSMSSSPYPAHHSLSPLPPTTNQLDASQRADRIWRHRKLARVFGRMPGTEAPVTDTDEPRVSKKLHSPSLGALLTKQKAHRHAVSVSLSLKAPGMRTEPSTPWQTDALWSPGGRRHSTPLATGSFKLYVDDEEDGTAARDPLDSHALFDSLEAASTRSFIDLSDEEIRDDDLSGFSFLALHPNTRRRLPQSNSTPSLAESLDPEAQAEGERRRKREKLARLHRFLGSRIPPEVVTGTLFGPPLPPPPATREECNREHRLRSNKTAAPDEFARGKEELDEREKALNVRRAQKMERVFGTQPPQVLFRTRPSRLTVPASPTGPDPYVLTLDIPSSSHNRNQSAYMGKTTHRQGPSDSSRCLLPPKEDTPQSSPSSFTESFADSFPEALSGFEEVLAQSSVYLNYQHSLNSLIDIIDRDDRKSLVELHRFLHGEVDESSSEEGAPLNPRRTSNASTFRSERRYSLPSNASMTSLSSEFHTSAESWFQIRRRKAAKLTNFFGVDYRELIHDILESIEKGVEEERKQGTLRPQEVELFGKLIRNVQVLMNRVRSLRTMQDALPSVTWVFDE